MANSYPSTERSTSTTSPLLASTIERIEGIKDLGQAKIDIPEAMSIDHGDETYAPFVVPSNNFPIITSTTNMVDKALDSCISIKNNELLESSTEAAFMLNAATQLEKLTTDHALTQSDHRLGNNSIESTSKAEAIITSQTSNMALSPSYSQSQSTIEPMAMKDVIIDTPTIVIKGRETNITQKAAQVIGVNSHESTRNIALRAIHSSMATRMASAASAYAKDMPAALRERVLTLEDEIQILTNEVVKAREAQRQAETKLNISTNQLMTAREGFETKYAEASRQFQEKVRGQVRANLMREAEIRRLERTDAIEMLQFSADKACGILREIKGDNKLYYNGISQSTKCIKNAFPNATSHIDCSSSNVVTSVQSAIEKHITTDQLNVDRLIRISKHTQSFYNIMQVLTFILVFWFLCDIVIHQADQYKQHVNSTIIREQQCWGKHSLMVGEVENATAWAFTEEKKNVMIGWELQHIQNEMEDRIRLADLKFQNQMHTIKQEYELHIGNERSDLLACHAESISWKETAHHIKESFKTFELLKVQVEREMDKISIWKGKILEESSMMSRIMGYSRGINAVLDSFSGHLQRQHRTMAEQLAAMSYIVEQQALNITS